MCSRGGGRIPAKKSIPGPAPKDGAGLYLLHRSCGEGKQAVVADPPSVMSSITLDVEGSHPEKILEALPRNYEVKGIQIPDLN